MATYCRMLSVAVRFRKVLWHGAEYFEDDNNAAEFKRLLIESGPVFIKVGQWMAQRPDVFPSQFIRHLESLQREAPQHSLSETRRTIREAFGDRLLCEIFESFETVPIASGSIAQVYAARYKGRDVVVKVLHPNVMERVRADLELLRKVVRVGAAANNYHCKVIDVDRVTREMLAQCDMHHEKRCIETIALNFQDNPMIHFPEPLFASTNVLIETLVTGIDYGDIATERDPFHYRNDEERERARALCKQITMAALLQMILRDALLHADLHRGNLLYHMERVGCDSSARADDDDDPDCETRLVAHLTMLDLGIVVHLNDIQMDSIHQLIVGLYAMHPKTVTDALAKVAMQNNEFSSRQMDAFAVECAQMIRSMDAEQKGDGGINISNVMDQLLRMLHRNRLLVDGNLIRVMVDFILVSEGRPNKEDDNLTDDTIEWVLYEPDGDYFPIIEHLIGIPLAIDRREMNESGRVKRDSNKQQSTSVRSLSAARTAKYSKVETLSAAKAMQSQSRMESGTVLSKKSVGRRKPRKRTARPRRARSERGGEGEKEASVVEISKREEKEILTQARSVEIRSRAFLVLAKDPNRRISPSQMKRIANNLKKLNNDAAEK